MLYSYSNQANCSNVVTLPFHVKRYRTVDKYAWMAKVASPFGVSVLMDADVLIQCTRREIQEKLGRHKIILSAERNQYPVKTKDKTPGYINSGVIIGSKKEFVKLASDMRRMPRFPSCKLRSSNVSLVEDQLCLQSINERVPRPVDWNSELILNLYALDIKRELRFVNGSWIYRGHKPCFIHSNGHKWPMRMLCSTTPHMCLCHSITKKYHF